MWIQQYCLARLQRNFHPFLTGDQLMTLGSASSPVVSGRATRFVFFLVSFFPPTWWCDFSLEGRDRTGLSHSWKWGSGAGWELVNDGCCSFNERLSRNRLHPRRSVQIHVEIQHHCCPPRKKNKTDGPMCKFLFYTSDETPLTDESGCCPTPPMQSQLLPGV